MQDKLQELTDKLYQEGLSKGKQEGEAIIAQAKAEAERIINEAQAEAERIRREANKEAFETKSKVATDIKMAATQSMAIAKQEIENMIIAHAIDDTTTTVLSSEKLMEDIIRVVVNAYHPEETNPLNLELVLPENIKNQIEPFIRQEICKQCADMTITFSKKIKGGFKIVATDHGYAIQFTDEEFIDLISNFLRPTTKQILFG